MQKENRKHNPDGLIAFPLNFVHLKAISNNQIKPNTILIEFWFWFRFYFISNYVVLAIFSCDFMFETNNVA